MNHEKILRCRIKWLTWFFILGLAISGATAIPLRAEVNWLINFFAADKNFPALTEWLSRIGNALNETEIHAPFLFYGTDWLAFGHFIIALVFIGALRDPVRNRWLFDFGLIACALVIPFAFIFGGIRGIPIWWRLIDCSFGIFGSLPLWLCRKCALELERFQDKIK